MQIAREFDSLFTGEFAGIGVAARVPNTPQGIVAWEGVSSDYTCFCLYWAYLCADTAR